MHKVAPKTYVVAFVYYHSMFVMIRSMKKNKMMCDVKMLFRCSLKVVYVLLICCLDVVRRSFAYRWFFFQWLRRPC